MRHDVLPLLRAHFNPRVDAALARTADILRWDQALLDDLARAAASRTLEESDGRVKLRIAELGALPAALARRVALRALETAYPGRSYGLEEADSVRSMALGQTVLDLAGVRVERSGEFVVIQKREERERPTGGFDLTLPIPGSVADPLGQWEMAAERCEMHQPPPGMETAGLHVVVDAEQLSERLRVRSRRPGDRLQPLGMSGRKKVQDVLVDRKVPRDERDEVPIVTDMADRIVWVAGHALDEGFRVTPRTTTVVMLTLRRKRH